MRIAPLYWALTLFFSILLIAKPSLFGHVVFSLKSTILSLTFLSSVIDGKTPVVLVGWTLEYEMLFYILFAVSLYASSLSKSVVITSILIAFMVFLTQNLIFLDFSLGMIIGLVFLSERYSDRVGLASFLVGVLILVLSIWTQEINFNRFALFAVPSALIVFGALYVKQINNKYLINIGNASYSIYLVQVFTIPAFYKFIKAINITFLSNDIVALACLLLTLFAGELLYLIFELKVSHLLKVKQFKPLFR